MFLTGFFMPFPMAVGTLMVELDALIIVSEATDDAYPSDESSLSSSESDSAPEVPFTTRMLT